MIRIQKTQESTASRKDVTTSEAGAVAIHQVVNSSSGEIGLDPAAGTQALPVDIIPKPKFDRTEYQKLFMRDKRKADKLGMKVSEYRANMHTNKGK